MIEREIAPRLKRLFGQYPFVTVTGPRQSGKTTLCRETFSDLAYVNLEAPDHREFAESDPRGFLSRLDEGAILDEIQRVPDLLSYLQVVADERGRNGLFILTGSEHFKLSEAIGQSLAGRTALLRLLPFTLAEREQSGAGGTLDDILYSGFYPRIYDQGIDPRQALGDYFETYVERDVRRLGEIRNVANFQRFVRLCAGRVGQLVNFESLGSDAGVSHTTVRNWLDLLERSYIAFRLPPFHANLRKRLVKTPKLYFYDVGLAAYLIGIERADQVASHPLRGSLFENMVVVEVLKHRFNRGRSSNLSFFRDSRGLECDLLFETGSGIGAIEIKSGATIAPDFFASLNAVASAIPEIGMKAVVYGGPDRQSRNAGEVVPFDDLRGFLDRFENDPEMVAFVEERMAPEPSRADIDILDNVYRRNIRPTLDVLDGSLKKHLASLFTSFRPSDSVKPSGRGGVSGSVLGIGDWERTKAEYIAKPGFSLSDERPLKIGKEYRFENYNGARIREFNIVVFLEWTLESEGFLRTATVNETQLTKLDEHVRYAEVDTRSARIDSTVWAIENGVKDEIEKVSGTR
ncbi:MAG: ATP-binding protein [Rhodospirillaceae bacterium]|nr:ATP-binding protein [Rhodospirillaceae bacterium]MDE0618128.1 ATP-binding protein [Rhodospirillaceae bacterium]